jgi:hypothetical protein
MAVNLASSGGKISDQAGKVAFKGLSAELSGFVVLRVIRMRSTARRRDVAVFDYH